VNCLTNIDGGKDRKGSAMKKILGIVVLFAFIFSSCATAPATVPIANHKNKNTITFAVKGFERFGFLDLKASDPADGEETNPTGKETSIDGSTILAGAALVGIFGLSGWFLYDSVTNPDSFLNK
jgi:ribosomal protein S6E (S10)